jgi:methyl-accepting chemotaxis protein
MNILRRILGVFVMIAGIIGLLLSIAGLVGLWMVKPVLISTIDSTVKTLINSIDSSQKAMTVTNEALGATVNSVDALSEMLGTTAKTVNDTQPVITQVNDVMGKKLPTAFTAANDSLNAAEEAARSMEGAIKSFDSFRAVLGGIPFLSSMVPADTKSYNPDKPLADSLGELAASLQDMPTTFENISTSMDKADDNLQLIKGNLDTMSTNVALISTSLRQYQSMIGQSQASMNDLKTMLANFQKSQEQILNTATMVLALFFLWLLAAQVVIFSQGWELYQGTASRMEAGEPEKAAASA